MRCPGCNLENPQTANFCQQCGQSLIKKVSYSPYEGGPPPKVPRNIVEEEYVSPVPKDKIKPKVERHVTRKSQIPQKRSSIVKIIIPVIVIIILFISVYWFFIPEPSSDDPKPTLWDPGFEVESYITAEDKTFYETYPRVPMLYSLTKRTITQNCDILFAGAAVTGEDMPIFTELFNREIALYNWALEGAQVSASIENLAQRILRDVGSDRVEQARAIYNFVANYLQYSLDGAYEFPITSLIEREGQCSEYATLLTSLYMATGFQTYYVFTAQNAMDYFQLYHIYIALYLPELTSPGSSQRIITSELGDGWIGLDPTNNQYAFGVISSSLEGHTNIVSIMEPITSVTIYDVYAEWDAVGNGSKVVHLDVYLKTWDAVGDDNINLTFKLHEHEAVTDSASFHITKNSEESLSFDLRYNDAFWKGETEQYITISVQ